MEWKNIKRRQFQLSAFSFTKIELNAYEKSRYAVAIVNTYILQGRRYELISFHAEYKSLEVAEDAFKKLDNILDTLVELKEAEVI